MRVLVVTSQFPLPGDPQRGRGVFQTILRLARIANVSVISPVATYPFRLRPRSYTYHAPRGGMDAGVPVRYIEFPVLPGLSRPLNGWLCARAIAGAMESARPDVVLSYWLYPDAYGAMKIARRMNVPIVAGARGSDLRARDALSRCLTRRVVRGVDRLLVVSKDLGQIAVSRDGARQEQVRVIPNGCDSSLFRLRDRLAARRELGVALDARLLLYVGRLVAEKGLRELLAAMSAARQADKSLRLAIVGEGPMRAEIEESIRSAGQGVVTLTGALDPPTVANWMAASNVVVLPSYSEGHPNVLVEALACGRPFVATPVGGVLEVADPSCAVLVAPRDSAALARGILEALSREWDEAGLARRHSRGWDDVALETLNACSETLGLPAGAADPLL